MMLAVLAVDGSVASASVPTTPLTTESFTNPSTTSTNWVRPAAPNQACLTAATNTAQKPIPACSSSAIDSAGSGTLRLTNNSGNQVGSVFNTVSLPGAQGLDITFNSYQYSGTGADGIAFVLAATDPGNPQPPAVGGPYGGSLGYSAQKTPSVVAGVSNGYLGFGLDVFGNFESSNFGGTGCPASSAAAESFTVRGPGNGTNGYCVISTQQLTGGAKLDNAGSSTRPAAVPVEIAVNPGSTAAVTASGMNVPAASFAFQITPLGGTGVQNITGALPTAATLSGLGFPASWYDPTTGVPYQLTFGWAASTGGSNEIHEINTLHTSTVNGQVPVYGLSVSDNVGGQVLAGGNATFTVTPSLDAAQGAESSPITVTATLPTGITPGTATGTGYTCTTSGQTVTCTYAPGGTPVPAGTELPFQIPVTAAGNAGPATITAKVSSNDSLPATASEQVTWGSINPSAAPSSVSYGTGVILSVNPPSAATGSVTFTSGATTLCTASAPGYSCATSSTLPAGHYPVTATLTDPTYGTVTSTSSTSFDVTKATATFTAAATPSSTPYGTAVTLSDTGLPGDATGTVTFTAGGSTLCTVTLPATSCQTATSLAASSYNVTADYSGDNNYAATSANTSFAVTKAATAITAAATDPAVSYGQAETLTVGNVPTGATGTVTFTADGSTLCTVTLPATSCQTLTTLSPAAYDVAATYSGDANHDGSAATTSFTVSKGAASGLAATATPTSAQFGSAVTLGFSGLPAGATGSVTFAAGGTTLCTVADVTTAFSCTATGNPAVGAHAVTAAYSGDSHYQTATATTSFTITKAESSALTAAAGQASISHGDIETVSVAGLAAGATGSVTFTAGGAILCTIGDVTAGSSCQPPASLTAGSYHVTATYSGDASYEGATATTTFTVTQATTSVTANPRAHSLAQGQSQSLSAPGLPTDATGTITFSANGKTLCTVTLPATACTTASLTPGAYHVTASYSGDTNYTGSTSTLSFTVAPALQSSTTTSTTTGTTTTMAIADAAGARTLTVSTAPTHGTAKIVNGQLIYTPVSGYTGPDTVVVQVIQSDGSISYQTVHLQIDAAATTRSGGLADTGITTRAQLLVAGALLAGGIVFLVLPALPNRIPIPRRGRHS